RGFNQAAQKIEHLINANNLLLAHASHELRTPITRIRLQIEMMDMLAGALPSDTKEKFDKRAQAINRDLSGLNDLVESILLVSRLDAGHALQQVEHLDLYDLVNQERQHYPEATLIGEHIVIDGQSSMLTHLIRNLLTNAMLHGKPPVTVLLYGVQTLDEADAIPDYLLQTILCSSFVDYNSPDFDYDEEAPHSNHALETDQNAQQNADATIITNDNIVLSDNKGTSTLTSTEEASTAALLPAPVIYKNGESITVDAEIDGNTNSDNSTDTDKPATAKTIDSSNERNNDLSSITETEAVVEPSLLLTYQRFTTDSTEKIKKVIWRAVPEQQETSIDDID